MREQGRWSARAVVTAQGGGWVKGMNAEGSTDQTHAHAREQKQKQKQTTPMWSVYCGTYSNLLVSVVSHSPYQQPSESATLSPSWPAQIQ